MKRGSSSRKCSDCGKIIFWFIPNGKHGVFGEPLTDTKKVCDWTARNGRYQCRECYEKTGDVR